MDGTGPHREVDAIQRLDTGEFLDDSFHAQQDGFLILIQIFRLLIVELLGILRRIRANP